jgi:hypothetical protein
MRGETGGETKNMYHKPRHWPFPPHRIITILPFFVVVVGRCRLLLLLDRVGRCNGRHRRARADPPHRTGFRATEHVGLGQF